jgi:hypothetical protein
VFDRALLEMGRVVGLQAPWSAAGGREDASAGEASRAAGEASRAAGEDPDGEDEVWYLV